MQRLRTLAYILAVAAAYFLLTTLAVAAILPKYAINVGLVVMILAMLLYAMLIYTGTDEQGPTMGFLAFVGPVACALIGVLWWILRLLGFWD